MEIRVFFVFIIFSSIFPSIKSKTFSLNDAIEAEEKTKSPIKLSSSGSLLSGDRLQAFEIQRQNIRDLGKSLSSSLFSPFKHRKSSRKPLQIKSPLKFKTFRRPRKGLKIVNPTLQANRQLKDEDINENYIPIFKSLSIILDDILQPDSREAAPPKNKYKRNNRNRLKTNDVVCNCALKPTTDANIPNPYKEAAAAATFISVEVQTESPSPSVTTTETHRFTHNNIGNIRRNQNVPVLPTRNTIGLGRNDSGVYEGRSTPHIRNGEGFVTRNNGDHEHYTRIGNFSSDTENSEEDTNNDTQYRSSSHESRGIRRGGEGSFPRDPGHTSTEQIDAPDHFRGNVSRYEENTQLPHRTIQTESPIPISKLTSRLQRIEPQKTEVVQPKGEKDYAAIERFITSAKQIFNRNSKNSSIDKRSSRTNEAVVSNKLDSPHNKGIMIFDGYSVARDVNGENKMLEKAIEIHT